MSQSQTARSRPGKCPSFCAKCKGAERNLCERKINHDKAKKHDCGKH